MPLQPAAQPSGRHDAIAPVAFERKTVQMDACRSEQRPEFTVVPDPAGGQHDPDARAHSQWGVAGFKRCAYNTSLFVLQSQQTGAKAHLYSGSTQTVEQTRDERIAENQPRAARVSKAVG